MSENKRNNFELIHSYSRAEAIEDGYLADVTEWASAKTGFLNGFMVPVALTRTLWTVLEDIPEDSGEDIRGRAHDVLFLASLAARGARAREESEATFEVLINRATTKKKKVELLMVIGPGDNGEAVITIGFKSDF